MTTASAESSLAYAKDYHGDGITVVPLRKGDKRPSKPWKKYRERPQREDELAALFPDSTLNVGVLGGVTSDNLLILDHDDLELSIQLRKSSIFNYLILAAPTVKTRRGFHIYVKTPVPVASSKCEEYGADILGEGKYAVAPPSRVIREHHRDQLYLFTGEKTLPLPRLTPEQFSDLRDLYSLKTLEDRLERPQMGSDGLEVGDSLSDAIAAQFRGIAAKFDGYFYGLGSNIWHRLKHPLPVGQRSEDEAGIVFRCVAIGWTFADVFELFRRYAGEGSKFREKQAQGYAEAYLGGVYRSAETEILSRMTDKQRAINNALIELQARNPFTGRGASAEKAVLVALLQLQREVGGGWVSASFRRIGEIAGLTAMTAFLVAKRLEERGILAIQAGKGRTTRFFVQTEQYSTFSSVGASGSGFIGETIQYSTFSSDTLPGPNSGATREAKSDSQVVAKRQILNHDAFRAQALGKEGRALLEWFREVAPLPFTKAQAPTSYDYSRRVFPKLVEAGIIRQAVVERPKERGRPSAYYVLTSKLDSEALDCIADVFGTKGAGDRQKERHARERKLYKLRADLT